MSDMASKRLPGLRRGLGLAALALVLPACGDGDTGPQGPPGPSNITSIAAGDGLLATPDPIVTTGTLSVDFGGSGVTTAVARSDHHHDGTYLPLSGGTLTGALTVGGVITGDGSGLSALDAGSLSSGTLPDSRLGGSYSGSVSLSNTGNSFTGSFTLGTAATRYLSVSSSAFRPLNGGAPYEGYPGLSASAGNPGTFVAPVHLPHGAQITAVHAVVRDNYDAGNVVVFLAHDDDVTGSPALLAGVATTDPFASPDLQTLALSALGSFTFPLAVANDTRSYSLAFQHDTSNPALALQLFRVRITYTITSPLP